MYQVSIFNYGFETVIHSPNPSNDAPHLLGLEMRESLSQAEQLSFSMPFKNPGFDIIKGLVTKVKVLDTRDNSVIFNGRIIPTKDGMESSGEFTNQVTCEGAMNYLIDTNTRRWHFTNQTPSQILQYLLEQHNLKVDASRQIYLGIVQITQPMTLDTNFESTLNTIVSKIKNVLGGDLRVQERSGKLYLDYLTSQGSNNGVKIKLGYNLKQMVVEYDPTDVITRAIPLGYGEGINQLDITSANGGVEYIEDIASINTYGIIEDIITNKDIQDADTLKVYGQTVLNEKRQPRFSYTMSAYDLSVLTGHEDETYEIGDIIETVVDAMSIDVYARVIERDRDLLNNPWDPTLTISTRPIRLTDQIIDLKQRNMTLENAPQGSTYIDTFGYADNVDNDHSFQLPIWISPDVLNVNRVRLHIDGQKYRAYEKNTAGGGHKQITSGQSTKESTETTQDVVFQDSNYTYGTYWDRPERYTKTAFEGTSDFYEGTMTHQHGINDSYFTHSHYINFTIPGHSHDITHTHTITEEDHTHPLEYGIFEDSYPRGVYVKINDTVIAGPFESVDYDGTVKAFSIDLDLTSYIEKPGQTYNLELTSSQNGRINAWVSVQAFIQAK